MARTGEARECRDHKKMTRDQMASRRLPPKGWLAIMVGREEEQQQQRRFVVPVARVNHPLFAQLLQEAEKEYGFSQKGVIVIPCSLERFLQVQHAIDCDCDERHGGHHLPQFTACFGA